MAIFFFRAEVGRPEWFVYLRLGHLGSTSKSVGRGAPHLQHQTPPALRSPRGVLPTILPECYVRTTLLECCLLDVRSSTYYTPTVLPTILVVLYLPYSRSIAYYTPRVLPASLLECHLPYSGSVKYTPGVLPNLLQECYQIYPGVEPTKLREYNLPQPRSVTYHTPEVLPTIFPNTICDTPEVRAIILAECYLP